MMQFANCLSRRGYEVDVISLRRQNLPRHEIVDGVSVHRIHGRNNNEQHPITYLIKNICFLLHAAVVIARAHLRRPYNIIHVQSVPDFLVFAALIPKLLGARVILDLRDLAPELYASRFRKSESSILVKMLIMSEGLSVAFADHVIVANPIWRERIAERHKCHTKCTMIWYYPDPEIFYPRPRLTTEPKRGFVIIYPGSLNWHQGVDIAVKAFPEIVKEAPDAEFHIYGEGPETPTLKQLIEDLGMQGRVKLMSTLPIKSIVERMAQSDLGIVPKRAGSVFGNEAASSKIPEFLALGVPVVASRTKIEMCFFDESLIEYFQSEDVASLVSAVLSVYRSPELRSRLSANGRRYVQLSSLESTMSVYLQIIDKLVPADGKCSAYGKEHV